MREAKEEESQRAERERVRIVGEEDTGRTREQADDIRRHAGRLPRRGELVGDAACDHDADHAAGIVPDHGVEHRPEADLGRGHVRVREERVAQIDGRPHREAEVREHLETEGHHEQPGARLHREGLEGLQHGGLRLSAGRGRQRLRVAQEDEQHKEENHAEAAEHPERIAPGALSQTCEPARGERDGDDRHVERALHDRHRHRARLVVQLAQNRVGRGRVEALSRREHDAVDRHEVADERQPTKGTREARCQNREGEQRHGDQDRLLAAEEIPEHAGEEHADAVDRGKHRHDRSPVTGRDRRELGLHLRQHGIEDLPRALLHEIADGEQRQRHPLVGSHSVIRLFVVHMRLP